MNSATFTSGATYKVAGDVNVGATFEAESSTPTNYPVSFTITDGHKAVKGATVTVRATTLSSDAQGVASLNLPNGDYTYSAHASGYREKKGEFKVHGEALAIAEPLETELPGQPTPSHPGCRGKRPDGLPFSQNNETVPPTCSVPSPHQRRLFSII